MPLGNRIKDMRHGAGGLLVVILSFVVQFDIFYSYIYYIDRNKMQIIYN